MIIYSPLDGDPLKTSIRSKPRHCFLMTRLGLPIPEEATKIINVIEKLCGSQGYTVIDAKEEVTGRDLLLKIWRLITASPLSIAICHEGFPEKTQMNIYYELGIAQAMGKETIVVKSLNAAVPSDLIRSEYIVFDDKFSDNFLKYLKGLDEQAEYYRTVAEQVERNPLLALDYFKRFFLISGDERLRKKARTLFNSSGFQTRAKNSVENLIVSF